MNLKLFTTIALTCFCGILFLIFYIQKSTQSIEEKTIKLLQEIGFQTIHITTTQHQNKSLILQNITLDPEKFSHIESITIHYDWWPLLTNNTIEKIEIKNIQLTGEINNAGTLTIAGYTPSARPRLQKLLKYTKSLTINNGTLDLMSDTFGGLQIEISGEANNNGPTSTILASIHSQQRQLSFISTLNGILTNTNGAWEIQGRIEKGRIITPSIEMHRIYGEITSAGNKHGPGYLNTQFTAGQLKLYNHNAHQISGTAEYKNGTTKLVAEGKSKLSGHSSNDTAMEFGLIYSSQKPDSAQISIFTPTMDGLLNYLQIPPRTVQKTEQWQNLSDLENFTILLQIPSSAPTQKLWNIPLLLKKQESNLSIRGKAILAHERSKNKYRIIKIDTKNNKKSENKR